MAAAATISPVDRRFDVLRKRADQENKAQTQTEQDLLKRRFASMGGINQGSAIKQATLAEERSAKRGAQAREGIDIAEMTEAQRQREILEGRQFASGEAEKQRGFMAGESQLGRQFAAGESAIGRQFAGDQAGMQRAFEELMLGKQQKFAAGEAATQREFMTGEREASQTFATGERVAGQDWQKSMIDIQQKFATGERVSAQDFAQAMQGMQQSFQQAIFDKQYQLDLEKFGLEKAAQNFNTNMAEYEKRRAEMPNIFERGWKWMTTPSNFELGRWEL